jgi:hypothetical protein
MMRHDMNTIITRLTKRLQHRTLLEYESAQVSGGSKRLTSDQGLMVGKFKPSFRLQSVELFHTAFSVFCRKITSKPQVYRLTSSDFNFNSHRMTLPSASMSSSLELVQLPSSHLHDAQPLLSAADVHLGPFQRKCTSAACSNVAASVSGLILRHHFLAL